MTDLVSRLRELANHRSSILGKRPEEMEEWHAAEEISELREALDCEQTADKDLCWMIWSNEHRAWWRPESCGYTRKIGEAGLYSYNEAKSICFPPHFRGGASDWPPPEIMVASWGTELLDLTKEHFQ